MKEDDGVAEVVDESGHDGGKEDGVLEEANGEEPLLIVRFPDDPDDDQDDAGADGAEGDRAREALAEFTDATEEPDDAESQKHLAEDVLAGQFHPRFLGQQDRHDEETDGAHDGDDQERRAPIE